MSTDPSPPHLAHVLTMTRNVTTDEVTSSEALGLPNHFATLVVNDASKGAFTTTINTLFTRAIVLQRVDINYPRATLIHIKISLIFLYLKKLYYISRILIVICVSQSRLHLLSVPTYVYIASYDSILDYLCKNV